MKKIFVPIDDSEFSERALLKAKELAEAFDSQVVLVNVMNVVPAVLSVRNNQIDSRLDWPEIIAGAKGKANGLLERSRERFGERSNHVETVLLDGSNGDVAKAIMDYEKEYDADLIVVGGKGSHSMLERWYLGSVTNKLLHHVSKPILVVP